MKINKFKKINSNKYKVFIDDKELILYEDIIIKYELLYKKEIDNKLLKDIEKDNYRYLTYDLAVKYISIRMRSKKELKEYLLKKGFNDLEINNTIDKLLKQNLINDDLFCKSYINDKLNLSNDGINKIKQSLLQLGVEEDIIDNNICNTPNELIINRLTKIINKELKLNAKLPINKLKNKIINKCIMLGYNYENINEILNTINIKNNSNIKNDYDKLIIKYNKKYEGTKLKLFIKNKLYQKGYSVDEINNIME